MDQNISQPSLSTTQSEVTPQDATQTATEETKVVTSAQKAMTTSQPEFQLMVYNVGKRSNVGNMIRSAVAFGCTSLIVIGQRKVSSFGHQNTIDYMRQVHYDNIKTATERLHAKGFKIVGVEISPTAKDVTTHPFHEKTVFMFGSEGIGMSQTQIDHCDEFIYIPQYGKGTASLNVSNAAAIVMHHFALWANYQQREIEESKFVVDANAKIGKRKLGEGETWEYSEEDLRKQQERAARRKAAMEQQERESLAQQKQQQDGGASMTASTATQSVSGHSISQDTTAESTKEDLDEDEDQEEDDILDGDDD